MSENILIEHLAKIKQIIDDVTPDLVMFVDGKNRRAGSRARAALKECKKLIFAYKPLEQAIVTEIKAEVAERSAARKAKKAEREAAKVA